MSNFGAESFPIPTFTSGVLNSFHAEFQILYAKPAPVYPTRVAPDGNDIIVWMCDDPANSAVIASTGSAGSVGNLAVSYGSPRTGVPGIFGDALHVPASAASGYHTANDTAAISPTLEPAFPVTFSGWVLLKSGPSSNSAVFAKSYRLANQGWSNPFHMNGMYLVSGGVFGGTDWGAVLIVGGSDVTLNSARRFNYNRWHHFGWTYDGTVFILYQDGDEVARVAQSGAIDYGNHGPWYMGGNYISGGELSSVIIQDCRVANVARPASYFKNVFEKATMQFGAT